VHKRLNMTSVCSTKTSTLARPNPTAFFTARVFHDPAETVGVSEGASRAMDRYSAGDDAAFADVYDFLAPRLLSSLSRRTRDRVRAEDLLQRTFMHIHRSRGTFIPGSDVLRWAYAISRRLTIDELRRRSRDPVDHAAPDSDSCSTVGLAEGELTARETATRLQRALAALPGTQREAFELVRFDGLSHEQAAAVLGTTVCAVKLRAHRAYEALRAALEECEPARA
jgi:RNA polymerase sigma-70 factor (ECF subfamily)